MKRGRCTGSGTAPNRLTPFSISWASSAFWKGLKQVDDPEEIQVETPEETEQEEEDRIAELVEFIAKTLANYPDAVKVRSEEDGNRTIITLEVDDRDKGKVIGRQGRVAQALRSLLRVAAVKQNTRINLEIE